MQTELYPRWTGLDVKWHSPDIWNLGSCTSRGLSVYACSYLHLMSLTNSDTYHNRYAAQGYEDEPHIITPSTLPIHDGFSKG